MQELRSNMVKKPAIPPTTPVPAEIPNGAATPVEVEAGAEDAAVGEAADEWVAITPPWGDTGEPTEGTFGAAAAYAARLLPVDPRVN
jgi:hypothetical protein